jgi:deoxyribodipyrimidine photo-lyase
LQDSVALNQCIVDAQADGDGMVVPCYLLDVNGYEGLEGIRQHSITESLRALEADAGPIAVFHSVEEFASTMAEHSVTDVHHTKAFEPAGISAEKALAAALSTASVNLHAGDSYYAVAPGLVRKPDGTPYRVYTPFQRAWQQEGWLEPQRLTEAVKWAQIGARGIPQPTKPAPFKVRAGEAFALRTWQRFKERALDQYDELRNRADLSGTSHLSHALAFGEIHPRTLLTQLNDTKGHEIFRKEIAWREFYADVLHHNPASLTEYYEPRFARMRYDTGEAADAKLAAWQQGKTGFPMVDAGMRQLLADGWMHNRVRMIVASFLVKDLHLEWQQGAEWFERHLSDFDPASNAHGWQWTAGCGTDASPYYRVFNPVLQGFKFDPNGDYVRKYVPELRHIADGAVHEPWNLIDGYVGGYVTPMLQHDVERNEALARLEEIKGL